MDNHHSSIFKLNCQSIDAVIQASDQPAQRDPSSVKKTSEGIHGKLPTEGLGLQRTYEHLWHDVVPGLNGQSLSPTYYGLVTGGVTPAARIADNLVTLFDQNVTVHLPEETVATILEDRAQRMLLELLDFEPDDWPAKSFTTGATASNILGLACGRDFAISEKLRRADLGQKQGEGLLASCLRVGVRKFQVLTTLPHSSVGKAANIVGIGSSSLVDVSKEDHFLQFDMAELENHLKEPETASIVVISCGEVNTGFFATNSTSDVRRIRELCDQYGAWLHVDGAFGIFTRTLPETLEYATLRGGAAGLELADSIAGDGHKMLNVPYDCGFFFCRNRDIPATVFQNANAAYLSSTSADGVVSPLNTRLENSARFRGLPVYATLFSHGKVGYTDMVARMVHLARRVARFIKEECPHLQLLPKNNHSSDMYSIFMVVLFSAREDTLNNILFEKIKSSRQLYASGTKWEGRPAVRLAIAKWNVDVEKDFGTVRKVLKELES